ncbi:nodulin-like protein, putative [Bodo saltans]|uniref:Nodulin-like protein, putative n=1 Tax=Bodo saltans TaxID=75058 RepID=A0A0S4IIJ4_BODSA|nr:nodulin-like protein, putative [Bodo saltans]|eukprot:CUE72057.1 nodulin-like protein, putative [Bodo saltans]
MDRTETLLACCMLMLTVGAMYSFSAFSGRLGEEMNFDATELNLIGTAYNLGTWFGVLGGLFCDRFGPLMTIRYGALICNIGTVGSALACLGVLPQSSPVFAALAFIFSQGTGWAYLSGMKQGLQVFHRSDHSSVVGTLSCYVALSAGVLSQLYKCALSVLPLPAFYVILGVTCAMLQLGSTHFFGEPYDKNRHSSPELKPTEARRLREVMLLAVLLMCWIFIMSLVESHTNVSQVGMFGLWIVMMLIVCGIPALSLWWRRRGDHQPQDASETHNLHNISPVAQIESSEPKVDAASELVVDEHMINESIVNSVVEERIEIIDHQESNEARQVGLPFLLEAMKQANFWLLALAITSALAFPVTFLNNLTPYVQSIRPTSELSSAQSVHLERVIGADIALFSVGNSLGRLASGFVAHTFTARLNMPRWGWFVAASLLHFCANGVLLISMDISAMYWVAFIAGAGLGVTFSISPIATSDMYLEQNFATMWGALTISPCITTELLGTLLAGHVADEASEESHIVVNGHTYCSGTECFQLTFIVTLLVECVGLVATLVLLKRLMSAKNS